MSSPKPTAAGQASAPRTDRRRARTRQRLIGAARRFLLTPGYADRSIADITEAADVGLGSFYNHFTSKDELYAAAVNEVLDEHGALLDATLPQDHDPAAAIAVAIQSTARLVLTNPELAQLLATQGMAILDQESGAIPRVRSVLVAGISSGRFAKVDVDVLLASIIGSLLAALHLWLRDQRTVDEQWCNELTERLLALCGAPPAEARSLSIAALQGN